MNSTSPLALAVDSLVLPLATPIYHTSRPSCLPFISDKALALLAPIVAYWVLSLFFHLLDTCSHLPPFSWMNVERYRIHEDSPESKSKNRATPTEVLRAIIVQQFVQTMLGIWWISDGSSASGSHGDFAADPVREMRALAPVVAKTLHVLFGETAATKLITAYGSPIVYFAYWWAIPAAQFLLALFIIDTWQYFLHRLFHVNKFLYKHIHSVHHRLNVPYAYGALYNHPLEGFMLDSLGAALAESLSCMSVRQATLLFSFSTLKTVDDHCGFALPWDPLQFLYRNNVSYHDIHHQTYGLKYNFSQPFFIHWDILMGTRWDRSPKKQRSKDVQSEGVTRNEDKEE